VELVEQHCYAGHPPNEGMRRLGYDFASGFQETLGGKLVLAALPMLSGKMLLMRWPRFVKLGRSDMINSATQLPDGSVVIKSSDPAKVSPYFSMGVIDFTLERMNSKATVRLEVQSDQDFMLHYTF
jgi:uncharacterized protein (TIGR02265 family)